MTKNKILKTPYDYKLGELCQDTNICEPLNLIMPLKLVKITYTFQDIDGSQVEHSLKDKHFIEE